MSTNRLLERAARLLSPHPDLSADVDELSRLCRLRLVASPSAELRVLFCDLEDLRVRQATEEVAARVRRIDDVEQGLRRLRAVSSSAQLVDRACEEVVRSCGLERVLLSRVDDGAWQPWKVNAIVLDEEWFSAWSERRIPLGEFVLETELLSAGRPLLVHDTADPRIHPIIRAGHSQSYVVAPVAAAGKVIGFFHADHGIGGQPCTEVDSEALGAFAEGFAHLYERATLVERLHRQREKAREALFVVDFTLQRLHETEVALGTLDDAEASVSAPSVGSLTRREREVLEVLATGASNQQIAERLVISLPTVKTHVKNVLAKLGANNRAQAIAIALDIPAFLIP
ncbi:LuxR C-terminal-related transcriptional regulator [Candidatus Protofrankia californiensis]|uniref:LuxR C-terminal-related transcriptional regulator n=1 Tax=Candidatus Protofrankia californiensis TaxID=1839754 RepID=UPI001041B39E|nr:LuxR C-terminal-related transcriptional regulator [Candidatus Protofrankia californiensis]